MHIQCIELLKATHALSVASKTDSASLEKRQFDDRHGEVSRAMRNRCIELCLLDQQPDKPQPLGSLRPADDLMACLASQGVPGTLLPQAMVQSHLRVAEYAASVHE